MATTPALVTVEQFLALPEIEGLRRELSDGEIIETDTGNAGRRHEWVKARFNQIFSAHLSARGRGMVFAETMFKLGPETARIPDLCIMLYPYLPPGEEIFDFAPDIAIEIVSSESAHQLESKTKQFLKNGAKAIITAYPKLRTVHIVDVNGISRRLEQDQFLELPDLLPGFRVQVAKFFEGI
jgi:Uma2 family endonuclease